MHQNEQCRKCNAKHIIEQANLFLLFYFIDSFLLFFFFLNPQFRISHYYVRSPSSATNSSQLLKRPNQTFSPPLASHWIIFMNSHTSGGTTKKKCMSNVVNFWAAHHCLGIRYAYFTVSVYLHKILIFKTSVHTHTNTQNKTIALIPVHS